MKEEQNERPQTMDGASESDLTTNIDDVQTLEYVRGLSLELQHLAEKSDCADLAALLAKAAAEAHHQAEARKG